MFNGREIWETLVSTLIYLDHCIINLNGSIIKNQIKSICKRFKTRRSDQHKQTISFKYRSLRRYVYQEKNEAKVSPTCPYWVYRDKLAFQRHATKCLALRNTVIKHLYTSRRYLDTRLRNRMRHYLNLAIRVLVHIHAPHKFRDANKIRKALDLRSYLVNVVEYILYGANKYCNNNVLVYI